MERDYGPEIIETFGARFKKLYELHEMRLPPEIAMLLDRLKAAEQAVVLQDRDPPCREPLAEQAAKHLKC